MDSAGYVARYILKKQTGKNADYIGTHHFCPITGEMHEIEPEFALMSRNPGIGHDWITDFKEDVFPRDYIVVDNSKHKVPRYYTEKLDEKEKHKVKSKRAVKVMQHKDELTPERLEIKEFIQHKRAELLTRS